MRAPTFQAQNPAISGYAEGWSSCTAFAGAMVASMHEGVPLAMRGGQLRDMTHDHSGGLTLAQIDNALLAGWDINLNTTYRLPWAKFEAAIDAGRPGVLQGGYGPIADSRYDAGRGFRSNHGIGVSPGWHGLDPLADGRYGEAYKYHGEAYPKALLKAFAGKLNIGGSTYRELGSGLVYCSLGRDLQAAYQVTIRPLPGKTYRTYTRYLVSASGRITGHQTRQTKGFQVACSPPELHVTQSGKARVSLVQIRKAGSVYDQTFVSVAWAEEV